jgi:site-specific recombinase XerD
MFLADLTEQYLLFITHEQRLSKATVRDSRFYLQRFLDWLPVNGYPEATVDAFCETVLRRYFYAECARGLRPRTLLAGFYPLRALGDWLVSRGILAQNPAKAITPPKKDAAVREVCTDAQIQALFDACDRLTSAKRGALSRAVLSVLAYGGLRRQELLQLRIRDVNFEDRALTVASGKGSKARTIYPCRECFEAVREWLVYRPNAEQDWLWCYGEKRRLHDNGLTSLIEDLKTIAGLQGNRAIACHSIRHNCATRLMRRGAPLRDLMHFLGHSHLATTAIYLHADEESARRISELGSLAPPPSQGGSGIAAPNPQNQEIPQQRPAAEHLRRRRLARRQ